MKAYLGQLHPLLVHLPIGILILAMVLKSLDLYKKQNKYAGILPVIILIAFISGILSIVTGLLRAEGGGYEDLILTRHKYSAFVLAAITGVLYFLIQNTSLKKWEWIGWTLAALALFLTGEFGAAMTHGYGILPEKSLHFPKKEITNLPEAAVYEDIIKPILADKCYSCHSSKKRKGDLRLDEIKYILQGGEHGEVLPSKTSSKSELLERISLDPDDDDHMPPQGKKQLTPNEIAIVEWWIGQGSPFDKKVKELNAALELESWLKENPESKSNNELDQLKTNKLNHGTLAEIQKAGIPIHSIAKGSDLVSLKINKSIPKELLKSLQQISTNIVFLKVNTAMVSADTWDWIVSCKNIRQLDLNYSNINDTSIQKLLSLLELQELSLVQTSVSSLGLQRLASLPKLSRIYTFQSQIKPADYESLKMAFPKATIDSGHYQVPVWRSDTTIFTREEYQQILIQDSLDLLKK